MSGTATEEKAALEGAGEEQSDADDRRGSMYVCVCVGVGVGVIHSPLLSS